MASSAADRRLLVIDAGADPRRAITFDVTGPLDLLAFSGDWTQVATWEAALGQRGATVRLLDASRRLAAEAEALRTDLPLWVTRVAEHVVDGRTVRHWFGLDDGRASAFWYGSLAERNPFKCEELLLIAQARVLDSILREGAYGAAVVACAENLAERVFVGVITARRIAVMASARGTRSRRRKDTLYAGLSTLAKYAARGLLARGLRLPRATDRSSRDRLICVSYYPYVDRQAAVAGRFVNRFFAPLQRALDEERRPIWWVGIFVFIDGWSFWDAITLTRRFRRNGQTVALLDAYFTPTVAWHALRRWAEVGSRARRLLPALRRTLAEGIVPAGASAVVERLWLRSYAGVDLARGLYFHEALRGVARDAGNAAACVYQAEFQPWEQALNSHAAERALRTIGFLHTAVSRNYYFYFHPPQERTGPYPMPVPDTLAASGDIPRRLVAACNYPDTRVVEAIRHLHLIEALQTPRGSEVPSRPLLLVAGSIDREESRSILSLVAHAFPRATDVRIGLRSHPSQPLGALCREVGASPADAGYEHMDGNLSDVLREADLVLVGSSSLSIEALAFGCEVITPRFAAFLPLTPLAGFDDVCHYVHTPTELQEVVQRFRQHGPLLSVEAKRTFARDYWHFDRSLTAWRVVLGERQDVQEPRGRQLPLASQHGWDTRSVSSR